MTSLVVEKEGTKREITWIRGWIRYVAAILFFFGKGNNDENTKEDW